MAIINVTAIFNGVDPVDRLPGQSQVEFFAPDKFLGYYSLFEGDGGNQLRTDVTLTGSDWTVAAMRFGSAARDEVTTIRDANGNTGRKIDYLKLGQNSDVELISTRVKHIEGGDGDLHDLKLGEGHVYSVSLFAQMNKVATGNGYVSSIQTNNDSDIEINGDVGSVFTAVGTDKLTVNSNWLEYYKTRGGDNSVVVKDGAGIGNYKANNGSNVNVLVKDGGEIGGLRVAGCGLMEMRR
jgi:serralysin